MQDENQNARDKPYNFASQSIPEGRDAVPAPPGAPDGRACELFGGFAESYRPLPTAASPGAVLDAVLKAPAQLVYELIEGRAGAARGILALWYIASLLLYGAIMGSFSGGAQWGWVPLKMAAGSLLSAALCLPSLYIFTSLTGGRQTPAQMTGLLLLALTLSGILLVGFAPIAWIFSQSTGSLVFMGLLHLVFWMIATHLGMRLLGKALSIPRGGRMRLLPLWVCVYVMVSLQMSTVLRPMLARADAPPRHARQFFVASWLETLQTGGRR